MPNKCQNCRLVNYPDVPVCVRCGAEIRETENIKPKPGFLKTAILRRAIICVAVLAIARGVLPSLIGSADPLKPDERKIVEAAIGLLEKRGFGPAVFYLKHLAVFRANDNWLNASVTKENAYAATNFPFEIVTVYPDFFVYPADPTEQAAILLHKSCHLAGKDKRRPRSRMEKPLPPWLDDGPVRQFARLEGRQEANPRIFTGPLRLRIQRVRRLHGINRRRGRSSPHECGSTKTAPEVSVART